ncbi:hypothetical protein OB2597_00775 [Pseudooceanicola batsensis HTCC2597]|uniref:Uncharacterized protein n=2 Tax=Pseudooceanicola batsensis TaxID=314255 RepID=A3U1X2_PSEBH|nr:hypothetical protein OB2597_00775 [Pseudooceanicola batsensis HTCC2597]
MASFSATPVAAAPVTIHFEASELTTQGDPSGLLGFILPETVTGSFSFDDSAAPTSTSTSGILVAGDTFRADYQRTGFQLNVGTRTVTFGNSDGGHFVVDITNVPTGSDQAQVWTSNSYALGNTSISSTYIQGYSGSDATIANADPLNVAEWNAMALGLTAGLYFVVNDPSGTTSLTDTATYGAIEFSATPYGSTPAVPLPAAAGLLLGGLGVFGALSVGRRSKSVV